MPSAEALDTKLKMCAASASACEGWYVDWEVEGVGEAGDGSEDCASRFDSAVDEASGVWRDVLGS